MTYKTKGYCLWADGNSRSLFSETGASIGRGNYSPPLIPRKFHFYRGRLGTIAIVAVTPEKKVFITAHKILVAARNFENRIYIRLIGYYQNKRSRVDQCNVEGADRTNELKINIFLDAGCVVVGTKFVDFFSGKYFIPDFQYTRSDSFQGSYCGGGLVNYYVTARNVLVEANRSNEPSVLCQSTFN